MKSLKMTKSSKNITPFPPTVYSGAASQQLQRQQTDPTGLLGPTRPKLKTNGHFTSYMQSRGDGGAPLTLLEEDVNLENTLLPSRPASGRRHTFILLPSGQEKKCCVQVTSYCPVGQHKVGSMLLFYYL